MSSYLPIKEALESLNLENVPLPGDPKRELVCQRVWELWQQTRLEGTSRKRISQTKLEVESDGL